MLTTAPNKLELFNLQTFPKKKPPGAFRIFCVGGSTTFGRPYDDMTSFPGWLRELLPAADSSKTWEVINAGGVSYASYRVATLMEELVAYDPDLFVVYSGHNEFLERRTYARLIHIPPVVRRLAANLSRMRAYSLMQSVFHENHSGSPQRYILPAEVDPVLNHVDGPSVYLRDDQQRRRTFLHFESNVERMINIAETASARIVLITPASNIKDCSPFRSQHDSKLTDGEYTRWMHAFQRGVESEASGEYDTALESFGEAAKIDPRFAGVHFRMGHVCLALDQLIQATEAFNRSRHEDVCPLRAPAEISQIVRRVAKDRDAVLVDFDAVIRKDCLGTLGHESVGSEYFLDHVHLTIDASRLLALSIIDVMAHAEFLHPTAKWNDQAIEKVSRRVKSRVDERAHAVATRNLARVLWWAGKRDEAGPLALRAIAELPDDPDCLIVAASYLRMKGDTRQAAEYFSRAIAHGPADADANHLVANLWFDLGEFDKARKHLNKALLLRPADAELHCRLGEVLYAAGKRDDALEHYAEALRIRPDYLEAQRQMAIAHNGDHVTLPTDAHDTRTN